MNIVGEHYCIIGNKDGFENVYCYMETTYGKLIWTGVVKRPAPESSLGSIKAIQFGFVLEIQQERKGLVFTLDARNCSSQSVVQAFALASQVFDLDLQGNQCASALDRGFESHRMTLNVQVPKNTFPVRNLPFRQRPSIPRL